MKLQQMCMMLILLLQLAVGTSMYSAEPDKKREASEDAFPIPVAQIAKWISQLGNDEFKVREQATQGLAKGGANALPALLKATKSKQAEVRFRAFEILFAMSKSDDQATAHPVRTALDEMVQSKDRRVAQAKKILEYPARQAERVEAERVEAERVEAERVEAILKFLL